MCCAVVTQFFGMEGCFLQKMMESELFFRGGWSLVVYNMLDYSELKVQF